MKRSKHSLSHYKLLTGLMGKLIPCGWFEVLPGDSIQMVTSCLMRFAPMLAPVMHPVQVRIHHFFVPYRLLWEDWEVFITGGSDGLGDGAVFPYRDVAIAAVGSLEDYLGLRADAVGYASSARVSAMPFRAYGKIFNEFYRDQDLVAAVPEPVTGGADGVTRVLQNIAWEKDYFTSARPWTQKGPEVTLPLGNMAPVVGDSSSNNAVRFAQSPTGAANLFLGRTDATTAADYLTNASGSGNVYWGDGVGDTGLFADLTAATAANVNDVRRAFALQRYQEARAQYGSRYTEYLRYLGIRSSDARLQRPEYLGGGKATIAFTEVLQTGPDTSDDGVADLKGHGISALRTRRFRRFFEEHGLVMSLLSVRPKTIYSDGLHRSWLRFTKEDFFQKELERIGQQEVFDNEIYLDGNNSGTAETVFGYQDRYSDYRHHPSSVAGDFRDTLDFWHLSRMFTTTPTLNGSFVQCDPSTRIFASTATDHLWTMVSHSIQARRMVSRNTIGRIF